ncbi:hypothetical protein MYMA111404_02080 [Mycoplasma marinum]|uniref:Uncharacterized protein n=1 Tax=Mycoplasma marinum TaxID=1937190 RepID=A0A4R0XR59_9MOLU|nr:hypothetical protein [Mycoplasma marinum]TCG11365.1 hypothetical protein C4B24_02330 [Mycoplasma marinum]
MNPKSKVWINLGMAVLAVTGFILIVVCMFNAIEAIKPFIERSHNIGDKMSDDVIKSLQAPGLTINGHAFTTSSTTAKNISADLITAAKASGIKDVQELKIFSINNGEIELYSATAYAKELVSLFKNGNTKLMWIISIAIVIFSWIGGIITSIIAKGALKASNLKGGMAGVIFAIFKVTGIPFLITAIITAVKVSGSSKQVTA